MSTAERLLRVLFRNQAIYLPVSNTRSVGVTKAELVARVYEKAGVAKKESAGLVETLFEIMKSALESGETLKVSGFGSFIVNQKKSRKGRNPRSGEEITISARSVLTFKPSAVLKSAINGK